MINDSPNSNIYGDRKIAGKSTVPSLEESVRIRMKDLCIVELNPKFCQPIFVLPSAGSFHLADCVR